MKSKIISLSFMLFLSMSILAGCSKTQDIVQEDSEVIQIVCTTFPQYDWVKEILGDKTESVKVTLLLDKGVDIHNYQPSAAHIAKILESDLFIYTGGESEGWVRDLLKESSGSHRKVISMMDTLGDKIKKEEIVEGMDTGHNSDADMQQECEIEYDEHVWLSIKNAEEICKEIAEALKEIDPSYRTDYEENLNAYLVKLQELNKEYETVVKEAQTSTILFGDRFPFRYLLDDYGLQYFAAFPGCSAETEASFETIVFLANKLDELSLSSICVIENTNESIAQTIINNTKNKDQKILVLNSMQAVTKEEINQGTTYLSIMKGNLDSLKQALNEK